jgi:hypothetical protein
MAPPARRSTRQRLANTALRRSRIRFIDPRGRLEAAWQPT